MADQGERPDAVATKFFKATCRADKFALRHIRGAVSLPFTDFTAETLARVIPLKDTRVLIYCNNNFRSAPRSLVGKAAPASLNISTYIALATPRRPAAFPENTEY